MFITRKHRISVLKCVTFSSHDDIMSNNTASNIWFRSSKIPIYGEGLADKGFDHADLSFSNFNRVRTTKA